MRSISDYPIVLRENGNKYLVFASTEALTKYTELWDKIKDTIEKINDKPGEYGKTFIKTKIDSDDDLSLNKY